MDEDFLAKNNPCGQSLLQLVSRGNAVIAELLRLKDHIPQIFRLSSKADQQKYGEVILDFNYFSASDSVDKKIESNEALREISDEICEQYGELLGRFYNAYESIYKYITDLNAFVDDVEEGIYIQQTMDTILLSEDGLQLMCESVYLYGVMLFVLEIYHGCPLRERLVVAYSRYNITVASLDHVSHLIRATGFSNTPNCKRPANYPQDFFRRIQINEKLLQLLLGKLRTEDIYHQQKALPLPHHSTTAFAHQAAILFITLFFLPNVLHNQTARMREIVDKYFPDNWIVDIYMGITINLIEIWEPFRAARMALANSLEACNIQEYAVQHAKNLHKLLNEADQVLAEGVLDKTYLMENISKCLSLVRECNVTLRWLILHTAPQHAIIETVKRCKQVRDQVLLDIHYDQGKILKLLFNSSELENKIRELFQLALDERVTSWEDGKKECLLRISELTEIFAGTKQMMRVKKSESFRKWFEDISTEIKSLDIEEPTLSARKVAQLVQALDEVQGFRQMCNNLGVKQLVSECSDMLRGMLGAVNMRDTLLVQLQIMSDFSYGWLLIDSYSGLMQARIREDPATARRLRAVFLKLSSGLETPLLRINQADDGDLPSVSGYYSQQLLSRVRGLLQVIPSSVFKLMAQIADLQTQHLTELPPRVEKEKLKDFASLPARFEVAKLTDKVSAFSRGLLTMEATLVGIVCLDPRELLETGVRDELATHIRAALEAQLHFTPKLKGADLKLKLDELGATMQGHKNSFEYIQDYIGINGVKMWQEELKNALLESVESECKVLQKKSWPFEVEGQTFVGRLAKQILLSIDPKSSFFVEQESAWVDSKTRLKVVDLNLFKALLKALSVPGLVALDRIVSVLIVKHLQELVKFLQKEANNNRAWLEMFSGIAKSLSPYSITVDQPSKVYPSAATRLSKLFAAANLFETLVTVGNLQVLRKQISFSLNQSAKIHARNYTSALLTVNDALLQEVAEGKSPTPGELGSVAEMLAWVGANEPLSTVYVTSRSIPYLALFLFLFTTAHIPRFSYDKSIATHICKKTGEGWHTLVVGVHTFLKQFHKNVLKQYILLACQYAKSNMLSTALSGKQEIPQEGLSTMYFLEDLLRLADLPRTLLYQHIPPLIIDLFKHGISTFVHS